MGWRAGIEPACISVTARASPTKFPSHQPCGFQSLTDGLPAFLWLRQPCIWYAVRESNSQAFRHEGLSFACLPSFTNSARFDGVTIWAKELQVFFAVVKPIVILVVHLKCKIAPYPIRGKAAFIALVRCACFNQRSLQKMMVLPSAGRSHYENAFRRSALIGKYLSFVPTLSTEVACVYIGPLNAASDMAMTSATCPDAKESQNSGY